MPSYFESTLRPTIACVSRSALVNNINLIRSKAKNARILAVLKADGYGHGADIVASVIEKYVWSFGVATVEEGILLRKTIIRKPIMVLGALWPFEKNFGAALESRLIPTISSVSGLEALEDTARRLGMRAVPFYLKIDTGMGRIGLKWDSSDIGRIFSAVKVSDRVKCEGVYTHFSSADFDTEYTKTQYKRFSSLVKNITADKGIPRPFFSVSNSAGLFFYPKFNMDLVRPGISIYGLQPSSHKSVTGLIPALTWKTRVVFLKKVKRGTPISYGRKYKAPRTPTTIATIPVGYADGYRRAFSNNAEALINGERVPVAGRVTMDMTMLDVTEVRGGVSIGDEVVLIGRQGNNIITAEELARRADTINYEITCGISPQRVPRVVVE